MSYLSSVSLCDLLGRGVKLALQLATLLPIIKHLHLVGTKLGATQVNSKEFTLLCNKSGQPSPVMAKKYGPDAMLKATFQGPCLTTVTGSSDPSQQVILWAWEHHQEGRELATLRKGIGSLLLACYVADNSIFI